MSPSKMKATADLEIIDSGKGALITFGAEDTAGAEVDVPDGTPPLSNIQSSDPNITAALNDGSFSDSNGNVIPANPMQVVALPSLQSGAKLPITGIVVSAETTFPGASAPSSASAPGLDLNPGAAAGLAVLSETAN